MDRKQQKRSLDVVDLHSTKHQPPPPTTPPADGTGMDWKAQAQPASGYPALAWRLFSLKPLTHADSSIWPADATARRHCTSTIQPGQPSLANALCGPLALSASSSNRHKSTSSSGVCILYASKHSRGLLFRNDAWALARASGCAANTSSTAISNVQNCFGEQGQTQTRG